MTRHRLLNKYTLFVFVFVLIFLLVAWFFSSDTYRLIFKIPLEEIKEYTTTQSKWEYFQFINELRSLDVYKRQVQNVVRQFGPYLSWA